MSDSANPFDRLSDQTAFIVEIDKAKGVLRQSLLTDGSRRENDAEHSWHLATMAIILQEHADEEIDLLRTVKMLLIHDLVEIDAGDTFAYDEVGNQDKEEREKKAADRIFALLPDDQGREFRSLWEEFESRQTAEARFASALDRLQPLLLNFHSQGQAWRRHGITRSQVIAFNRTIEEGSKSLWQLALKYIDEAVQRGYLKE